MNCRFGRRDSLFRGTSLILVTTLTACLQIASCNLQRSPTLAAYTSFAFFAEEGEFSVYKLGELVEKQTASDMRDGQLRFVILGPGRGLVFGNMGSSEVEVLRSRESVSFVEMTPTGSRHVFTVYDEWLPESGGFRATYIRNSENPLTNPPEVLRTVYSGYARDFQGATGGSVKR